MHVFALPFPTYSPSDETHQALAELAARAEEVASSVGLSDEWQFQKARRVIREALAQDGVAAEINEAVEEMLHQSGALAAAGLGA